MSTARVRDDKIESASGPWSGAKTIRRLFGDQLYVDPIGFATSCQTVVVDPSATRSVLSTMSWLGRFLVKRILEPSGDHTGH
jgi:hypothetical protein